ncbi:MAG: lipid-A-disaccharide synthase [Rickettsiales bacterium]|nr:lipid-A-disaccharide synthase [Rickettsiales bacterium]
MQPNTPLRIYIIAGEASGDLLGAHLMAALKKLSPRPIQFHGVGGERMQAEGLASLFPYHNLSLFGFVEILPKLMQITARINQTAEDILQKHPDIVITIDVPGFCLRVIKKVREANLPALYVHYVAPTVWAYNPWRAQRCAELFDHMLTLLPFEAPYFTEVGLPTTFVGHAAVVEAGVGDGERFRQAHQIAKDTPLFCLLPGSRRGEIKRHMPIFAQAIAMLARSYPELVITIPVPEHILPYIEPYLMNCPFPAIVTTNEQQKKDAIAAATLAIVKSGTVTFEVAKAGTPMMVCYRLHPLSAWLLRRKVKIRFVNLINMVLGKEIIPELLQERCTPLIIAATAQQMLQIPELIDKQKQGVGEALAQFVPSGGDAPSTLAAKTILGLVSGK